MAELVRVDARFDQGRAELPDGVVATEENGATLLQRRHEVAGVGVEPLCVSGIVDVRRWKIRVAKKAVLLERTISLLGKLVFIPGILRKQRKRGAAMRCRRAQEVRPLQAEDLRIERVAHLVDPAALEPRCIKQLPRSVVGKHRVEGVAVPLSRFREDHRQRLVVSAARNGSELLRKRAQAVRIRLHVIGSGLGNLDAWPQCGRRGATQHAKHSPSSDRHERAHGDLLGLETDFAGRNLASASLRDKASLTRRTASSIAAAMAKRSGRLILLLFLLGWPLAAQAVQPDEVLSDPQLETRARALSRELRCMV